MEFISRKFPFYGASGKFVKEKDDSSSEDEGKKTSRKIDKNNATLRSPKPNGKWPPHLQALFKQLAERHSEPELTAAIQLLYSLRLDDVACNIFQEAGLVNDIARALSDKKLQFGDALSGRGSFLIRIFEHLVLLEDVNPAKKFLQLCDGKSLPLVAAAEANHYLHARLQTGSGKDKDLRKLCISAVTKTINGGIQACLDKNKLEHLINGCVPSARPICSSFSPTTWCRKLAQSLSRSMRPFRRFRRFRRNGAMQTSSSPRWC